MATAVQCMHRFKLPQELPLKEEHHLREAAKENPLIDNIHVNPSGKIIEIRVRPGAESESTDQQLKGFLSSNNISFLYELPARKAA